MEFLLGFSFIIYVLITTLGAILLSKLFNNPEFIMLPLLMLFVFDGLGASIFYFVGIEIVDSIKMFKLGVSAAFSLGTMLRVIMLVYANKSILSS